MFHAQTTDPKLLSATTDWCDDANWREFYGRYAPAIRRHATASGLTPTEADDVVQETMLKVARYLPSYRYDRTVARFRTWLNQVVNQRIFETLFQRRRGSFSEEALSALCDTLHASHVSTSDPVDQRETEHRLLEACLARVRSVTKPRTWQVFEAHALHGLSAKETARLHGTTTANVWVIRHRLVKELRAEWRELLERPFQTEASG